MSKKKSRTRGFGLVDICIPIFGEWSLAEDCIAAIPQAAEGLNDKYRITVVDNGTPPWTDESGETLTPEEQSQGVRDMLATDDRFMRLKENIGYPGGVNAAVNRGQAPLILVLTADVVLQPKAITRMVKEMDDKEIGVVGPKLVFPPESPHGPPETIQHAGIAFNIKGAPFHIFIGWSKDHPKANERVAVSAVTGACFITRRSLWNEIGGLNEMYGAGTFEDMEYCFAARHLEQKVIYLPEAWGYHFVGGSMKQGAGKQGFNLSLNKTMFRGRWAGMLSWDEWRRW